MPLHKRNRLIISLINSGRRYYRFSSKFACALAGRLLLAACLLFSLGFVGTGENLLYSSDRLGFEGIGDWGVSNAQTPYSNSGADGSQTGMHTQLVLLGSLKISDRFWGFYEGRVENLTWLAGPGKQGNVTEGQPMLQGYLRIFPQTSWNLQLELGRFGSPFGQFLSRNYPDRNPLANPPLIYSYRTSLSPSLVPRNSDSILYYRELPRSRTSYADSGASTWMPLIDYGYPTGVMVSGQTGKLDGLFALVNSSVSNPLRVDQSGQKLQWISGGGWTPFPGLRLGGTVAAGPYMDSSVSSHLPAGKTISDYTQRALNLNIEYTLHHLEVYSEFIYTDYGVPNLSNRLGAKGYYIEVKHTWSPRFFTAVRWNQLFFNRIGSDFQPYSTGSKLSSGERWDYNTNSLERPAWEFI